MEIQSSSPHLALLNGEDLVRHPADTDGTLYRTANSRRSVRLLRPSKVGSAGAGTH
jgi:hypothetical protein